MTQPTRNRIAAAFERELAESPVPFGLTAQVLREKVRDGRDSESPHLRPRVNPWIAGLRGVGALVAVLLVVVLVATVLVGGRAWRDWNQFITQPAPATNIDPALLAELSKRPLNLPLLPSDAACPTGPLTTIDAGPGAGTAGGGTVQVYGSGPVYMLWWGDYYLTQLGWYWTMRVGMEPSLTGPVLIRARDLQGGQPLVFLGQNAAGTVVGTDSIGRQTFQRHLQLVLDSGHPEMRGYGGSKDWKVWVGQTQTPAPYLCAGFQIDGFRIDGSGFSEDFVTFPLAKPTEIPPQSTH